MDDDFPPAARRPAEPPGFHLRVELSTRRIYHASHEPTPDAPPMTRTER
jgi:hypothetical protein